MKEKASVAWSLSMPRGGPLAHQEHETLHQSLGVDFARFQLRVGIELRGQHKELADSAVKKQGQFL